MKYPKIRPLGHPDTDGILLSEHIVILEKLDGANFRWTYDSETDSILFGSRNHLFIENGRPAPYDRVNKNFRHAVEYIVNTVDTTKLASLESEYDGKLWFYGEALHKHTIDYDAWEGETPSPDDTVPNYLGFDIYSEYDENFLPHWEVQDIHNELGLETVPVVFSGEVEDVPDPIEIPPSEYRTPDPDAESDFDARGLAEGVIIKNHALGLRAKLVADEFSETNSKWQKTSPEQIENARTISGLFLHQYVTDARVKKAIHRLQDERGETSLHMGMMQDIPRLVIEDVYAEHGWELLNDDELEFTKEVKEQIRSKLSKKCSRVLKQLITANA